MVIDARGSGWAKAVVAASAWWVFWGCETRTLDLDDPDPSIAATGAVLGLNDEPADAPPSEWVCADGANGTDGSLPAPAEPLSVTLDIVDGDAGGDAVVPGLSIIECGRLDVRCVRPRAVALLPGEAPPRYGFEVPFQWSDTLRLTAPGYVDTRYFIDGAVRTSRRGEVVEMFQTTTIERVWAALGEEPGSERGLLFVRVIDCDGNRVAGAGVESEQGRGVESFHLVDGEVIRGGATSDDDGVVAFSVMAGFVSLEAFVRCSNGRLPRSRASIAYRLHALGNASAVPRPAAETPVCDANEEALIGDAAVAVYDREISITELRPGFF